MLGLFLLFHFFDFDSDIVSFSVFLLLDKLVKNVPGIQQRLRWFENMRQRCFNLFMSLLKLPIMHFVQGFHVSYGRLPKFNLMVVPRLLKLFGLLQLLHMQCFHLHVVLSVHLNYFFVKSRLAQF